MERCKKVTDLFGAYIYGDLSLEEMRRVRSHVEQCESCARDLETRTKVLEIIPKGVPELTDEDRQRIMWSVKGAIRAKQQPARSRFFSSAYVRGFAVATIVIAAFAGGTLFGFKNKPPKVIVKSVPVKQQPAIPQNPKESLVQQPPTVVTPPTDQQAPLDIAIEPARRDRLPGTWRHRFGDRNETKPLKMASPVDDILKTTDESAVPLAPIPDTLNSADLGRMGDTSDASPKTEEPKSNTTDNTTSN